MKSLDIVIIVENDFCWKFIRPIKKSFLIMFIKDSQAPIIIPSTSPCNSPINNAIVCLFDCLFCFDFFFLSMIIYRIEQLKTARVFNLSLVLSRNKRKYVLKLFYTFLFIYQTTYVLYPSKFSVSAKNTF